MLKCRVLWGWALTLGSGRDRCLYGGLLCPKIKIKMWSAIRHKKILTRRTSNCNLKDYDLCDFISSNGIFYWSESYTPWQLQGCGWHWPGRSASDKLLMPNPRSWVQVPNHIQLGCSFLCVCLVYRSSNIILKLWFFRVTLIWTITIQK